MSFQDYKLPPAVIADMYKSSLVLDTSPTRQLPAQPAVTKAEIIFKGKNAQAIAVIVACRQKLSETSAEIGFLLKILKACNLGLDDIALIDVKHLNMELESFITEFKPSRVLVFSKNFNGSPLSPDICFEVRTAGSAQIVYAPEVHDMQADGNEAVQLKKKLWLVLKNFFNV